MEELIWHEVLVSNSLGVSLEYQRKPNLSLYVILQCASFNSIEHIDNKSMLNSKLFKNLKTVRNRSDPIFSNKDFYYT